MPRLVIRRLPLAIVVITLLALVACGGGGATGGGGADTGTDTDGGTNAGGEADTGGGGGTVDLCAVLTLDEVSEATGADVTDTLDGSSGNVSSCNYNASDDAVAGHTYVTAGGGIDPGQMIDANLGGEFAEEISGLGDRAVLVGDDSFPILMVLKNNGLYSISVLADGLDAEGKRQASIDLARIALDRLP